MCSVFRTFQGWTALSSMARTEGVLNVLPIPHAMVYLLLRALQDDVADDDLCSAANGQSLPVTAAHHGVLLPGMSLIPNVEPGDTVWWHPDAVHSVDPVTDQKGWGSVMCIPAMVIQDLMSQPARNRHPTARLVTARNAPVAVVRSLAAA